jgi:hypothetical protein
MRIMPNAMLIRRVPPELANSLVGDEKLVLDLPRGRGKSIGGDLDVDQEGSEQINRNLTITTPWLCWLPTRVHTSCPHQEDLSLHAQSRTQARTGKNTTKLAAERLTHECGVLQTIEW